MPSHPETAAWHKYFFTTLTASLKDSRLWFVVLGAVAICIPVLIFAKPPVGEAISGPVWLIAGYLIIKMQALLKPDEKKLAESIYQSLVLPALVGILVIPSYDIFTRLFLMPWHWLHADYEGFPCSCVWIAGLLAWLGVLIAPTIVAILTRERAVFAAVVGLMVCIPLDMTDSFPGGGY
jgi:hypothetical protein